MPYRKSQLAIEYAYRIRDERPDVWVFWVHAGSATRVEDGFRKIAEKTQAPGWDRAQANILEVVSRWLENEENGPWVLIVDNADDIHIITGPWRSREEQETHSRSLLDYLPQAAHGSILMTSRSREVALQVTGSLQHVIEVTSMDPGTGLVLLRKKLTVAASDEDAMALVQNLDCIPLVITQAAAFINRRLPRITVSQYVQDLQRGDRERTRLLERDLRDLRRDRESSNSIITTWHISFKYIRHVRPTAARLLAFMSCFDPEAIPEDLLDGYQDDKDFNFEDDVEMLRDYCLIGMNIEKSTFKMHRLVQFSTQKWLEMQNELEVWQEKYIIIMAEAFPRGRYKNWKRCQLLFPYAEVVLSYQVKSAGSMEQRATVLYRASWYANERGWHKKSEQMAWESLEARSMTLGEEHLDTLSSMDILASTYLRQGRWTEAEMLQEKVIKTKRRVLGDEDPATLSSMNNLAATYWNQGRWTEAEALYNRVIEMMARVLGKEYPGTLTSMGNLATVLSSQGKYEQAYSMHRQVLGLRETVLGREHPETLTSMDHLTSVLTYQGKYEQAVSMCRQVLGLKETVLGKEHPDILMSINNLASVLNHQGKYEQAESMHRQVLRLRETVLGKEHPSTLSSMNNLADVLSRQGKYEQAGSMHRQVFGLMETVLGKDHPNTLMSMSNLANMLSRQGKYEQAESMHRQVLGLRETVLSKKHPDTVVSMNNLANVLSHQGKYEQAESMHRQALELMETVLGKEHPETLMSMNNLANVLNRQGKYEQAELIHRQLLGLRETVLGKEHPETLMSMNDLASVLANRKRYSEADALYQRALDSYGKTLAPNHPTTQACRSRYSCMLEEMQGDIVEENVLSEGLHCYSVE